MVFLGEKDFVEQSGTNTSPISRMSIFVKYFSCTDTARACPSLHVSIE